jgi:hypothetical protein
MICPLICLVHSSSGTLSAIYCCSLLVSLEASIVMGLPSDSIPCCCQRFLSFFAGLVLLLFLPFPVVSKLPVFPEYPPPVQQCLGHRPATPPMLSVASVLPVRWVQYMLHRALLLLPVVVLTGVCTL